MNVPRITALSVVALVLSGCSSGFTGISATGGKPVGAASTAPGAASKEPESPNSLPVGDAINGPVTGRPLTTGNPRY